jgi:hypothetical protein
MLWFLRGLRNGVVTTRYPKAVDPWAWSLPTPPRFRSELLTPALADRLVEVCPSGALQRRDDALVLDLGRCSACGRCRELGGSAIVPSGEFELAARRRATLLKRVPILRGER